jgi:hypothetical protein
MDRDPPTAPCCANCGVEIPWRPVIHRDRTFCCGGCAQGGPCYCSYDLATLDWLPAGARRAWPGDPTGNGKPPPNRSRAHD